MPPVYRVKEAEAIRALDELVDHSVFLEALDTFATERGHTLLELAFGWLLAEGATASVIAGATKPEQIASNVAAAGWTLSAEEKAAVDAIVA